jgi:hypothetical protein
VKADRERVLTEGLISGFIGYATVVVVFGLVNVATGKPFFHTAALLGRAVIGGFESSTNLADPGPIIAYNGIHLIAFVLIGLGAAWLIAQTERHPAIWYVVFYVFLAGFFVSLVVIRVVAAPVIEQLPWGWSIIWVNLAAAVLMGLYLWKAHPRLWREVSEHGDPEVSHEA